MSTTPPGPPRAFVISQPPMVTSCPGYKASESKNLGIAVLVMAVLSVGFGIASLIIELDYNCYNNFCANVGSGIWCGFFYFFAGGFALGAGRTTTLPMIRSNFAFSFIAFWFSLCHVGFSSCAVAAVDCRYRNTWDYSIRYGLTSVHIAMAIAVMGMTITLCGLSGGYTKCRLNENQPLNQTNSPQTVFVMGPLAHTHNQAVQPLSGQLQVVSGIIGQQQVVSGAPVQPQMVSGVPGPLVMMYPGQPQLVQTASPQYLVTPAVPAVIQMAQPQNPTPDTDQAVIQTVPPQYSATTDAASEQTYSNLIPDDK